MARNLLGLFRKPSFYYYNVPSYKNNHLKFSHEVDDSIFKYSSKYNEDEEAKIFKFLNESSPDDISRLSMSQQRLKRIISRRSNKGNFITFSDILNVDGLGVKVMEKMCDSILKFDTLEVKNAQKENKKTPGKILEPHTHKKKLNSIKTATAIYIHANRIAWAEIEKDTFILRNWNLFDLGVDDNKKLRLSDITQIVWDILKLLPKSDLYVMEAPLTMLKSTGADAKNPKAVHINLQKAQFIAVLNTSINISKNLNSNIDNVENEFDHKVIYIRSALPSRLFRTFVGNEKVSAETTVLEIIEKSNIIKNNYKILEVPNEIKRRFHQENSVHKEILSQTLLIALAFFEVCVFENQVAIKKISSYN